MAFEMSAWETRAEETPANQVILSFCERSKL
jgi:hypothetical protein